MRISNHIPSLSCTGLLGLVMIAIAFTPQFGSAADLESEMRQQQFANLTTRLLKKADRKALGEYYKISQQFADPEARSTAHAATAVGLHHLGDRETGARLYHSLVDTPFGNPYRGLLESKNLATPCNACDSSGKVTIDCNTCQGTGKCGNRRCQGGTITVPGFNGQVKKKNCPVCRGAKLCNECNGEGKVPSRCRQCRGRGYERSVEHELSLFRQLLTKARDQLAAADALLAAPAEPKPVAQSKPDDASPWITPAELGAKPAPPPTGGTTLTRESLLKSTGADKLLDLQNTDEKLETPVSEFAMWLANQQRGGAAWATTVSGKLDNGLPQLRLETTDQFSRFSEGERDRLYEGVHRYWKACCTRNQISARAAPVHFIRADGTVHRIER